MDSSWGIVDLIDCAICAYTMLTEINIVELISRTISEHHPIYIFPYVHSAEIQWTPVTVHPPSCCQIGSYMRTGLQRHVSAQIRCT